MRRHFFVAITLVAAFSLTASVPIEAQDFQGQVRTRSVSVEVGAFWERTESLDPKIIFGIPLVEILAMPDVEIEEVVHHVKGSKFRSQAVGVQDGPYTVVDLDKGVFRSVQPSRKTYVEWTAEDLKASMEEMMGRMPSGPEEADGEEEAPSIRPLGETKTINGARSAGYEVRSGEKLIWAWVTRDHESAGKAFLRMAEGIEKMTPMDDEDRDPVDLYAQYGLPMLTQEIAVYDGEAEGTYEIEEIVAVERQPVPDHLFAVPDGYQKLSWQDMMRGMMQQDMER